MILFPEGISQCIEDGNWMVVGYEFETAPAAAIDISTCNGKAFIDPEIHEITATLRLRYIGPSEPIPDCCDQLHVVYAEEANAT